MSKAKHPTGEVREHEAAKRDLHKAVRSTFAQRGWSDQHMEAWSKACREFHSYRSGVDAQLDLCQTTDLHDNPDLRNFALGYLHADPYYFRSGYEKERLLRRVKSLDFTLPEKRILQQVILRRIRDRAYREFRRYCQLIPRIETDDFRAAVVALAGSGNPAVAHRAAFTLKFFPGESDTGGSQIRSGKETTGIAR